MAANKDEMVNDGTAPGQDAQVQPATGGVDKFLREVWIEMKKTSWPTRNELIKFTVVVMVTIFAVAIYLYLADQVMSHVADYLFHLKPLKP